jgi:hypothetical protein
MTMLADLVAQNTATTGTGTVTLGAAVTGFRTLAASGIPDGALVSYAIQDGTNRETGTGTVGGSGTTITRGLRASSTGSLLSLTGSAIVTIQPNAGDFIGDNLRLPPRSGAWLADGAGWASASIMGSSGRIFYTPFLITERCTIDRVGISVQTGDAGTNAKLGIFASGSNRLPGNKIVDCAAPVSTATAGYKEGTFSVNPALNPGLYWGAWQTDSTGFTLQPRTVQNAVDFWLKNSIGTTNYSGENDIACVEAGTYASGLPSTATPTINVGGWFTPLFAVRVV